VQSLIRLSSSDSSSSFPMESLVPCYKISGQRGTKRNNTRHHTRNYKSSYSCDIIFLLLQNNTMKYKNRTEQQKIDPYDVPATAVDAVYIDDIDNITEEIELTLEQLQQAVSTTETLKQKIWKRRRSKNERR